jgi:hypothetical protein
VNPLYALGALVTGGITFIVSYIYCIANYGFLLGVGLGWLHSFIVAVVAAILWPLIALALAAVVCFVVYVIALDGG